MGFDVNTAYILSLLIFIITALGNIALWRVSRQEVFLRRWIIAYGTFIIVIGSILALRDRWMLGLVFSNAALWVYGLLLLRATDAYRGIEPKRLFLRVSLGTLAYAGYIAWGIFRPESGFRALFLSLSVAAVHGYSAWTVVFRNANAGDPNSPDWRSERYLAGLLSISGIAWLVRGVLTLLTAFDPDLSTHNATNIFTSSAVPLSMYMLNFGFVLTALIRQWQRGESYRLKYLGAEGEAVITRLLASMNHETNTPLGNAKFTMSHLRYLAEDGSEIQRLADVIGANLDSVATIIRDRNKILDTGVKATEPIQIDTIQDLFRRILSRNISTRKIDVSFGHAGGVHDLPTRYIFTFLLTALEIIQEFGRTDERARLSALIDFEYPADGDGWIVYELRHNGVPLVAVKDGKDGKSEDLRLRMNWLANYLEESFDGGMASRALDSDADPWAEVLTFRFRLPAEDGSGAIAPGPA